jgi:hypothetical protein
MALTFLKTHPVKAPPNTLRWHLHKNMAVTEPGRDLRTLHASDMTKEIFCPRNRMLALISGTKPKSERLGAATVATYAFGRAVETLVVQWFADAGMAVGDWQCLACKSMLHMQTKPEKKCHRCGFEAGHKYIERRFVSAISGVSCGVDLLINTVGPKLRVVEIKSMLKEDFKKLAGPLAEHKLRTNLYMRLVHESADEDRHNIDTETAYVIYVCKGGYESNAEVMTWSFGDWGYTSFKDFEIARDDSQTDALVEGPIAYKAAAASKTLPAGICMSPHDPRAKKCMMSTHCFSGKYPVGAKYT